MSDQNNLIKKIRVILSERGMRLFRNNRGMAWRGRVEHETVVNGKPARLLIDPYPIYFGIPEPPRKGKDEYAGGDLIGWHEIDVPGECCGTCTKFTECWNLAAMDDDSYEYQYNLERCVRYYARNPRTIASIVNVEAKTHGDRLKKNQKSWHNKINAVGGKSLVAMEDADGEIEFFEGEL